MRMKMMELSQASGMSLDKIKADLAKESSKQGLMRELAETKAQTSELTSPPIEPPQQAAPGRAYQD
jgi:hypothetical protein